MKYDKRAHVLAPEAQIMLVVAKSDSVDDLIGAIDYATKMGAQIVSMNWGGSEFPEGASLDNHFNHSGTVYLASSGVSGSGVLWPASSPNVIGVGGTNLPLDSRGNLTGSRGKQGKGNKGGETRGNKGGNKGTFFLLPLFRP